MSIDEKFAAIRKGLLEFLILKIVAADKVYVADILKRLSDTDFATQEGTLYPLLSKMRRDGLVDYEWQESGAGPPRKYYRLTAKGKAQLPDLLREFAHAMQNLGSRCSERVCSPVPPFPRPRVPPPPRSRVPALVIAHRLCDSPKS